MTPASMEEAFSVTSLMFDFFWPPVVQVVHAWMAMILFEVTFVFDHDYNCEIPAKVFVANIKTSAANRLPNILLMCYFLLASSYHCSSPPPPPSPDHLESRALRHPVLSCQVRQPVVWRDHSECCDRTQDPLPVRHGQCRQPHWASLPASLWRNHHLQMVIYQNEWYDMWWKRRGGARK